MRRSGRKKIQLNEDTIQRLLDECYVEANELNAELNNLYIVWNSKVGDLNEIAVLGKDIVKVLDQRDKLIDKKLKVAQQIQNILAEKNREENRMKLLSKPDEDKKINDASLPDEIDFKINEMIEKARKSR